MEVKSTQQLWGQSECSMGGWGAQRVMSQWAHQQQQQRTKSLEHKHAVCRVLLRAEWTSDSASGSAFCQTETRGNPRPSVQNGTPTAALI